MQFMRNFLAFWQTPRDLIKFLEKAATVEVDSVKFLEDALIEIVAWGVGGHSQGWLCESKTARHGKIWRYVPNKCSRKGVNQSKRLLECIIFDASSGKVVEVLFASRNRSC